MNRGILLWTEVVCAGCAKTTSGEFVRHGRREMRMVKEELKKDGWLIKDGEAYCPCCYGCANKDKS